MTTWHSKRGFFCSKTSPSAVIRESAKIPVKFIQKHKMFAKNVLYKPLKNKYLNLIGLGYLSDLCTKFTLA